MGARPTRVGASPLIVEMIELSRRVGADPEFVRAGGGNSSAKADGVMHIKPSGVSLAALTAESLIALALAPLREVLEGGGTSAATAASGAATGGPGPEAGSDDVLRVAEAARLPPIDEHRPSVELLFHALLPEPIVLHTHPTTVNTLTCAVGGRELAGEIFGEGVLWIPYTDPGLPLARAIRDERIACTERTGLPPPRAILLQNHGLIVSGPTASEIEARSREIVASIAGFAAGRPPIEWGAVASIAEPDARDMVAALLPRIATLLPIDGRPSTVVHDDSPLALDVAGSELGHRFARGGPLTPDQIVYAGSWPLLIDTPPSDGAAAVTGLEARLAERSRQQLPAPIIVLVAGLGLVAVGATHGQADVARTLFLDAMRIAAGAHRLGGVRPLEPAARRFIEDWEAEAYRIRVARTAW
ncbi:MAG: class II aldolase/adducin family protein [Chloroflexota bacterium]